jgi:hypothetical protein
MKNLLFLTCLLLLCLTLGFRAFELDKNDLANQNLKGKVKKVVTYNKEYGGDGASLSRWVFHYNIQGNTSEFAIYDITKVEKLFIGWRYTYDSQGREVSVSNELGEVMSTCVYGYNIKNNLTKKIYSRPEKHPTIYIVYNQRNTPDSTFSYDIAGQFMQSSLYDYDAVGNLIAQSSYKSNSVPDSKTVYKYDSNHQKIQETRYTSKGKESWTTFKYDDKGNVIMEVDSNVMRTGSGARIIPVHNVSLTGNTRTFIYYNFDKAGNWLEKKELINDVLYRTNKREIEYY